MPEGFRSEIENDFIDGLTCAVCTSPDLRVNHFKDYADFVACDSCGSSFVAEEGGDRVLYGKVSEQYADTEKVILRNWVTLAVVARLASAERERKHIDLPEYREPSVLPARQLETEAPAGSAEQRMEEASDAEAESQSIAAEAKSEDLYRVKVRGEGVYFPIKMCAHCMEAPAKSRFSISGSLPLSADPAQRRRAVFGVPLCAECRAKTTTQSGAQRNARLQAHLTSLVVGLALFVAALALGVVDLQGNLLVSLLVLGLIGAVGYLLPLGLLLPRARYAPPLREAYLAQTTLQVRPPDRAAAETYFDFRNQQYAQVFWEANKKAAVSGVTVIKPQAESPPPEAGVSTTD